MSLKAILVDITKCIGCKECEVACKIQNKLPEMEEIKLSATAYTIIEKQGNHYVRKLCMHCQYPTCESVCPVGALNRTKIGAVIYDGYKCIGCRYCMLACPFQIPKYEWMSLTPKVQKCNFCYEKILVGSSPACVEACPTEAAIFGDYDKIIKEARRIIDENPDKYVNYIYGEREVGGTSILYISDVPFEKLGFKTSLRTKQLPELTWSAISKTPTVVVVGGAILYGIWWITKRRRMVAEFEKNKIV